MCPALFSFNSMHRNRQVCNLLSVGMVEPINTFHGVYKTDNAPVRVSYHQDMHYNSVVDPYTATVGVGLGLAGYQPGVHSIVELSVFWMIGGFVVSWQIER